MGGVHVTGISIGIAMGWRTGDCAGVSTDIGVELSSAKGIVSAADASDGINQ